MLEFQLAPFIVAGLLVVTGYMFSRWLSNLGQLNECRDHITYWCRQTQEAEALVAGMRAEGCAALGALQNIFNGVTAQGEPHSKTVRIVADVAAAAILEVPGCDHKENAENWERLALSQHDELLAARLTAENWQNLAVESEAQAEEAERLLGLVNDRLAAERAEGRIL